MACPLDKPQAQRNGPRLRLAVCWVAKVGFRAIEWVHGWTPLQSDRRGGVLSARPPTFLNLHHLAQQVKA